MNFKDNKTFFYELSERLNRVIGEVADGNMSEFSRRINTSVGTVQNYIEGKWPKLTVFLNKINKTYKVNLQWLLTGFGEPYTENVSVKKHINDSTEWVEEYILGYLAKTLKIIELRSFPSDSDIISNYFLEFSDHELLFLHIDMDSNEREYSEMAERLSFIAMILGKPYLKIEIPHNDMIGLISDIEGESHQEYYQNLIKFEKKTNAIDSECNYISKKINQNINTLNKAGLIKSIWKFSELGNKTDIKYLKSFIDREIYKFEREISTNNFEKKVIDKLNIIIND